MTSARSYGGKTAAERAAERRDRLVEATITLLDREGADGTTMTAICAEAKLTERYFYESFESRDLALVAALDRVYQELIEIGLSATAEATGSLDERVRFATAPVIDHLIAHPSRAAVISTQAHATAALRARRRELIDAFADVILNQTEELLAITIEDRPAAHWAAVCYVAGLTELVSSWRAGHRDITAEQLQRTTADLFLAWMGGQLPISGR